MGLLKPVIVSILFNLLFIIIVFKVPYPASLAQANFYQIISFFASLFFALVFTLSIFLKNILSSVSISLGIILLFALKALNSLNIVTAILTVVAVGLLISYFRKTKTNNLAKQIKKPDLKSL